MVVHDDQFGDDVGDLRLDGAGEGGELRIPSGSRAEQDPERVGVVVHVVEVGEEAVLDLLTWSAGGRRRLGDRLLQLVADVGEQLDEELALGAEVLVQHRLGHAGGLGDVVHRRRGEALVGEHRDGDPEQLFSSFGSRKSHRVGQPVPGTGYPTVTKCPRSGPSGPAGDRLTAA